MFGGGQWVVQGHIDEKQCVYFPRMKPPTLACQSRGTISEQGKQIYEVQSPREGQYAGEPEADRR
jgi:hypothetical protein